jgi:hypothetical protein
MTGRRVLFWSLGFVLAGFVGAALRYWRWWPASTEIYRIVTGIACPLCPNVDSIGNDWEKFGQRTLLGGIFNLIPSLVVGWGAVGLLRLRSDSSKGSQP